MRYILLLALFILPGKVFSQNSVSVQPKVIVEAQSEDVVVGQPAMVLIKVLVPTFMPSPPGFPSLEKENLLVRLPERASGPVSESVNGETWSGVQRRYRVYPLIAGQFDLDATDMTVTFADPDTNDPVQVSVSVPAITINAVVPDAAAELNPLIIATGFELKQEIEGSTEMQAGDAITRRLTARISGTSPILIPPLIMENQDPILRPYPKEPRFTETEDRGVLSGQRVDETVFLAQDAGQTQMPAVSFQWYNLSTNSVETAAVDAVDLTLVAPDTAPPPSEKLFRYALWGGLLALVAWAFARWGLPRYQIWRDARQDVYKASPDYAISQLRHALKTHDLSAAYSALELWKQRSGSPQGYDQLETCLVQISSAKYASGNVKIMSDWSKAISTVEALVSAPKKAPPTLPPLNP